MERLLNAKPISRLHTGAESAKEPCAYAGEENGFFPSVVPVLRPVVARRENFFSFLLPLFFFLLFRFSLLQPIGPALRDGCGKAKVPEGYIFLYFLFLDDDVTTKNVYLCNHIGRICGRCCRLSAVDQGATPFNIVQCS